MLDQLYQQAKTGLAHYTARPGDGEETCHDFVVTTAHSVVLHHWHPSHLSH